MDQRKLKGIHIGKRGILFTITTILLLISLFTFALVYQNRIHDVKFSSGTANAIHKFRFIEDDIASSSYSQFLNLSANISRQLGVVTVSLSGDLQLESGIDYRNDMQAYSSFVQGIYANNNNLNITLSSFDPAFKIVPYSSSINITENNLIMYNNPVNLNQLAITIKVNHPVFDQLEEELQVGQETLLIVLLNSTDDPIYSRSANLDTAQKNKVKFDFGGSNLQILFGEFNNFPASTLDITTTTQASIREIEMQFTEQSQKTQILGGLLSITSRGVSSSKESKLILAEE